MMNLLICVLLFFVNEIKGQIVWYGNWAYACDFTNQDYTAIQSSEAQWCGPMCDQLAECTHYTWTNYDDGMCWLKYGSVSKSNAFYTGNYDMICGISTAVKTNNTVLFTVANNCPYTVYPGIFGLSHHGDYVIPMNGGWQLNEYTSISFYVPNDWYGARIWGRTGCSTTNNQFKCNTGDCGSFSIQCSWDGVDRTGVPPTTLAEFTINGGGNSNQDSYDLSLVDGFNVEMSIKVLNPNNPNGMWCGSPTCTSNINSICPSALQYKVNGQVVACESACEEFDQPQYCCTGSYSTSQTCPPTSYSEVFKNACPDAYSYAYDDPTSLYSCSKTGYEVTFC